MDPNRYRSEQVQDYETVGECATGFTNNTVTAVQNILNEGSKSFLGFSYIAGDKSIPAHVLWSSKTSKGVPETAHLLDGLDNLIQFVAAELAAPTAKVLECLLLLEERRRRLKG